MREIERLVTAEVECPDQVATVFVRLDPGRIAGDHFITEFVRIFGDAIEDDLACHVPTGGSEFAG